MSSPGSHRVHVLGPFAVLRDGAPLPAKAVAERR